ncbi:ATP-dependent DNA helicase [Caligus rogercresseyi]|uniref:ATP-dependent DNA helicase n=1 Tax=Caligus rogercresseyi TaxID=217165 RepID=A0A7T8K948_CALRO|nr:ATP-dependent DNA helicase [Caligus rogercresseyi]
MNVNCRYYNAMKYPAETPGLCCANGKVLLDDLQETPDHLRNLLLGQSPDSKNFMRNIRTYNSAFQMTSFGHERSHPGGYMPTFRIMGQVYHKIGSMMPVEGREHVFLLSNISASIWRTAKECNSINTLWPTVLLIHRELH